MNNYLMGLLENWREAGGPRQEGFDWTSRRNSWITYFPIETIYISDLPNQINREAVRLICHSELYSVGQKFLAVMIWGYGDRGYGPFRVSKMLNQAHSMNVLDEVFNLAQSKKPKLAYRHLMENRIHTLGPSYGTKFISFCTPREISAPIYDSLISLWIIENARDEFLYKITKSPKWNFELYSDYCDWISEHSQKFDCYPDEVELVLFRDAERRFAKSSSWAGK